MTTIKVNDIVQLKHSSDQLVKVEQIRYYLEGYDTPFLKSELVKLDENDISVLMFKIGYKPK